jgi:hypothetical protein
MIVLPVAQTDVHRTRPRPRVTIYPLNRNLGRRRGDVLDALRDAHNLPRPSISPKAANPSELSPAAPTGEDLQSSVVVHSAAEAPEAISPVQHPAHGRANQRVRVPPSLPSSPDGGTDPEDTP